MTVDLVVGLVVDPHVDHVLGEDIALEQELHDPPCKASMASSREPGAVEPQPALPGQIVDVRVQRIARIDLVLDAVDDRHQQRGKGQVAVAGGVGCAELNPLGLGRRRIHRNADGRTAVAAGIRQVDGRFETRYQPFVGVGGRVGKGDHRRGSV